MTQADYNTEVRCTLTADSYLGVLREPGIWLVNPCGMERVSVSAWPSSRVEVPSVKVVDVKGNPLIVSGVVTYQVIDSKRAALDVTSWRSFLSTQAEVVLKQICSCSPVREPRAGRGQSEAGGGQGAARDRAAAAGQGHTGRRAHHQLRVQGAQSYAPEIAASMLVRQQAEAMLEARQVVVEGGVRIAFEAITHLKSAGLEIRRR